MLQVNGKILPQRQGRHLHYFRDARGGFPHQLHQAAVIHQRRQPVPGHVRHETATVKPAYRRGLPIYQIENMVTQRIVVRAHCPLNLHPVRNHIIRRAAMDGSNGKHCRLERVTGFGNNRLVILYQSHSSQYRIRPQMRHGGMRSLPLHGKIDIVRRSKESPRADTYLPHRQAGIDMLPENSPRHRLLQQMRQQEACPAGTLLLAGLENHLHCPPPVSLLRLQAHHCPQQHGEVHVMPAGVHLSLFL